MRAMRSTFAVAAVAATLVVGAGAMAASAVRPARSLDALVKPMEGGAIGGLPKSDASLEGSDPLRAKWADFRLRHPGRWNVWVDERTAMPTLVAGRGIEWFPADGSSDLTLDRVAERAEAFLAGEHSLLGDWSDVLELDRDASAVLRRGHYQLIFRQSVDGVRVENARLDLHVVRGRLAMFGATHWGRPRTSGVPTLTASEAREALDAYVGRETLAFDEARLPELTLVAVDADADGLEPTPWAGARGEGLDHALIWRFRFYEPGGAALWIGEVDAHDGTVRSFYDGTHYASVTGGVFPVSNDGDCATGGCEVAGFPMPFADYTETGEVETFADPFGNLMCADPGAFFETNLSGPYVNVVDLCGTTSELGTCDDGVDLGQKDGDNCVVEPGASPGNTSAARTGYYHITRAFEAARFYDPTNTWLQTPVTLVVNDPSSCNAFWNGIITMLGAGQNCSNSAEIQNILVHEWAHGYDENDGGGFDKTSEAYADTAALFAARDSCISRGIYNDGTLCDGNGNPCLSCNGFRDQDWAQKQWNQPATVTNFVMLQCPPDFIFGGPCKRQGHCEGHVIGETMFDLATRDLPAMGIDVDTAWQLAERLWYVTRPGSGGDMYYCLIPNSNSCGANTWYQRMRVADDDDGDLSNGTPHAAALHAAFARHGIACGSGTTPEYQNSSSCPALATPVLSVVETPGGTELSWAAVAGVGEYRVYRGDLGCNRQQIPIASLTGGETSFVDTEADPDFPRHYRVEVLGANPACSSAVSNCVSTPLAARLQMDSHRVVESGPDPNGIPDPGETVRLPVTLFNSGLETAAGVTGHLTFVDPAQGSVLDADATWADLPSASGAESDDPHFEIAVSSNVSCGDLLTFDLAMTASNATPAARRFAIQLGDPARDFLNEVSESIPQEPSGPVTSTIAVDQDLTVAELDVSIDISHNEAEELIVELTSPGGTTVRLHDQTAGTSGFSLRVRYDEERAPDGPGTMADFVGESTLGTWTLSVEDVGSVSTGDGTLSDWALHMTVDEGFDCVQEACAEPLPSEALDLQIGRVEAAGQVDLMLDWSAVVGAADYRVLSSDVATFSSGVTVLGETAGATAFTVEDEATLPSLTFLQVRGLNACGEEGP